VRHDWFLSGFHSARRQATNRRAAKSSFPYRRRLRIEPLEDRRMLDADLSGFAVGLRGSLTSFQNQITTEVQRASLPLLGAPISQLASNVNLRITQIDSSVYAALTLLGSMPTPEAVRDTLFARASRCERSG
jgi:hypothetical protein